MWDYLKPEVRDRVHDLLREAYMDYDVDGADGYNEQDAYIQIFANEVGPPGQHSKNQKGGNGDEQRGKHVKGSIGLPGRDVLLGQHLDGVG